MRGEWLVLHSDDGERLFAAWVCAAFQRDHRSMLHCLIGDENTAERWKCVTFCLCHAPRLQGVTEATHADKGIYIRSGIVVIQNGTTVPDGTVI